MESDCPVGHFGSRWVSISKEKSNGCSQSQSTNRFEKIPQGLHPLQHKAVPEENAQAIRDSLDHLLALGDSVFIAPMPENWQDIADTLNALRKQFKANGQALKEAAKGQDDKAVLNAFEKYHDSFEAMMHTLIDNGKLKPYKEAEGQGEGLEKKE
jgi:hypothetical protein